MKKSHLRLAAIKLFLIHSIFIFYTPLASAVTDCEPSEHYSFLCGMQNPEDLVRVPDTDWIIASSMRPGGGLYLVDSGKKTWSEFDLGEKLKSRQDMDLYAACPGPAVPGFVLTHGLHLRPGENQHSKLYVVVHGARESIEVFDVDASAATPALSWLGCVLSPDGMQFNSVTSLADGSLLATVPQLDMQPEVMPRLGDISGKVFRWSPGETGFSPVEGTELPYPNGIEVSADENEFYVASSGLFTVIAFTNTSPARVIRQSAKLAIVPDNLHMNDAGMLLTAGMLGADPVCGDISPTHALDIEAIVSCARPFQALTIDPASLDFEVLASGPAHPQFSNFTMVLQLAGELWIGSFSSDRLAYQKPRGN